MIGVLIAVTGVALFVALNVLAVKWALDWAFDYFDASYWKFMAVGMTVSIALIAFWCVVVVMVFGG